MSTRFIVRLVVALFLATVLFGPYLLVSGAPTRVHVAEGIGLVALLVIPALLVGGVADLKKKWAILLGLILVGVVLRDYLVSSQVAKADFAMFALVTYPIVALAAVGLVVLYAVLVQYVSREWLPNPSNYRLPQ